MFDKPDADENTNEYKTYLKYQEAYKELSNFKKLVDKANEKERDNKLKTGFFVIDASLSSNTSVIDNSDYASLSSPALISFYVGKVNKDTTYDKLTCLSSKTSVESTKYDSSATEKFLLTGGSTAESFIIAIKNASGYLKYTYNVNLD